MTEQTLISAALAVREKAYAPYSRFKVGAAIRATSGAVYVGANVENASYPQGCCAETSAIAAMIAAGERTITAVCVAADAPDPITPCGGCRQRLMEFSKPETVVIAAGPEGARARWTMADLLPAAFSLKDAP